MHDFAVDGGPKCSRGPNFREWNEILRLGKVLKFGVIFSKIRIIINRKLRYIEKFGKNANFSIFLHFPKGHKFLIMRKNKEANIDML